MRFSFILALAAAAIGSSVGCGGSETPKPVAGAAGGKSISEMIDAAPGVPADPIARVVYEFLDAMRTGDSAGVSQRLTPLALQRAKETDSPILPPGSPTAKFKVGAAEQVAPDKAVVDSVWTDLDVDGKPSDEPILWALKLSNGQWRVSGMMAQMGPNDPPVTINFEDPDSMSQQDPPKSQNVVASPANAPAGTTGGEVARNPFDQPAQR